MENLKLALEAVYLNELDGLPSEAELEAQVNLSPAFERRMKKLLHSQSFFIPGRRVKRMLLVAIIAALMASTMSVQAIREPIMNFFLEVHERCTDIIFQITEDEPIEEYEFSIPEPPEGYVETNREEHKAQVKTEYSTNDGDYLRYTQYRLNGTTLSVDTEDASVDMDQIQGCNVFLYSNKGFNSIVWSDGIFGYKLNGTCDVVELRSIAEKIMIEIK